MNDKLKEALFTGNYPCPECGRQMVFEDEEWRDSLVCEHCGYSCSLDDFGRDPWDVERQNIENVAAAHESETYEDVYDDD